MSLDAIDRAHALAEDLRQQVLEVRIALAKERDSMLTHAEMIAKLDAEDGARTIAEHLGVRTEGGPDA